MPPMKNHYESNTCEKSTQLAPNDRVLIGLGNYVFWMSRMRVSLQHHNLRVANFLLKIKKQYLNQHQGIPDYCFYRVIKFPTCMVKSLMIHRLRPGQTKTFQTKLEMTTSCFICMPFLVSKNQKYLSPQGNKISPKEVQIYCFSTVAC